MGEKFNSKDPEDRVKERLKASSCSLAHLYVMMYGNTGQVVLTRSAPLSISVQGFYWWLISWAESKRADFSSKVCSSPSGQTDRQDPGP